MEMLISFQRGLPRFVATWVVVLLSSQLGWAGRYFDSGVAGCRIEPPVHVGVVRDRALDERCGTTLYFSRDFRKRYDKPAFKQG
ncbi:MAG: hypothetical protein D6698_03455, partial [Gammaproteobacteria bacterium]